ncbi:MAG: polysaccharide deacetylase family protein [Mesorhizobium sp.]
MSRFEEVALDERDAHDRFPAAASLAWRAGFLYRPIVDEYVEVLWALMKRLWPGLERKRRSGKIKISCDVDQPFDRVGNSARLLLRSIAGDLGRRRDPALALCRARNFFARRKGDFRFDPYYTFDWYMDVCEKHGHKAAFYFIPDHSAGAIDGTYEIDEAHVLELMRKIAGRGHEIGMHGSYNTFRNAGQIKRERSRLVAACEKAGLSVEIAGNRQHYLRWDSAETPEHLDAAGFGYDTTGSFADRPGFRYGTSHPFAMWNWATNAPLKLKQHPLVLMECSVLSKAYLGMGHTPEGLSLMLDLKRRSLKYGGDFTLLWHNSEFLTKSDRSFFERLIQ